MEIFLAILAVAVSLTAAVLGIVLGVTKSKLTKARTARDIAVEGLHKLSNEVLEASLRYQKDNKDLRQEIETLYGDLESCGDDSTRGRLATRAIIRMLSAEKEPGSSGGESGVPH